MSGGKYVQTPDNERETAGNVEEEDIMTDVAEASKKTIQASWKNITNHFHAVKSYDWVEVIRNHYNRSPRPSALETLDSKELLNIYRQAVAANTSKEFIELIVDTLRGRNVDVVKAMNSR